MYSVLYAICNFHSNICFAFLALELMLNLELRIHWDTRYTVVEAVEVFSDYKVVYT